MKSVPDTFWKYTTLATVGMCVLLSMRPVHETRPDAETVRARRFVLVDSHDKAVGEWGEDQDNPRGISLRMYDPESKDNAATIQLMAVDGGVQVNLGGAPGSGGVLLMTSKGQSIMSLSGACTDPSHNPPMRLGLVTLSADRSTGRLSVQRASSTTINGTHGELYETLLQSNQ